MVLNIATAVPLSKLPPLFTYTGVSTYKESVASDGTVNWELALTSSGTLKFSRVVPEIDAFLVGGGKAGDPGNGNTWDAKGGNGGKGGTCVTHRGLAVSVGEPYTITVGGSGASTSAFEKTASSGGGAAGGTGARAVGSSSSQTGSTAGSAGYYAFGSANTLLWAGYRYGAGGGGGGARNNGYPNDLLGKAGGTSGGGKGGLPSDENPTAGSKGSANSGGGGGGGCCYSSSEAMHERYGEMPGGAGGSGIVIIRNAR